MQDNDDNGNVKNSVPLGRWTVNYLALNSIILNYVKIAILFEESAFSESVDDMKTRSLRGRFSLPCPGIYTNTIQMLSGVSWVSRDHRLPIERQYLGFLLYHQL